MVNIVTSYKQELLRYNNRMQATNYLIYDGDCGFCNTAVQFLRKILNPTIKLVKYQNLPANFCKLTTEEFNEAIKFIDSDRLIYSGAHAIFKALSYRKFLAMPLWLYHHLPFFKNISETIYTILAQSRNKKCKI